MLFNRSDLAFCRCKRFFGLFDTLVPDVFEQGGGQLNQGRAGFKRLDDLTDLPLDFIAGDRFAIGLAALGLAQIIGAVFSIVLAP